ncbi:hypothetical protein, partial [Corallococcus exiguus]|uniref:hypothetical protein n=1 Tax=Corallococcus exiguus TaxID=83462 RepID=UPI001C278961
MHDNGLLVQGVDALRDIGLNYAFVLDAAERQAFVRGMGVTVQLALLTIPCSLAAGVVLAACMASEKAVPNKRVYYLSLEFLIGRLMSDAMNNLGLTDTTRAALRELGVDLDAVQD